MSTCIRIRRARTLLVATGLAAGVLLAAAGSAAAAPFQVGIQSNNTILTVATGAERAANMADLERAGAQIVRISLHWDWVAVSPACALMSSAQLESHTNPCYSWAMYDDVMSTARSNGLEVMASVYGVPAWVLGNPDPSYMGASAAEFNRLVPKWAAFQKAAAARYAPGSAHGVVNKWTVHNEPNSSTFWKPRPNPKRYATLFRAAAPMVKEGNRSALVAAGPTGPYSPAFKPARFIPIALKEMTRNGSGKYLSAWAHNPYPGQRSKASPRAKASRWPNIGLSNINDLFRIMDSYKASRKKTVWATELAWESSPQDRAGVSMAKQAEYMGEAFDILESTNRVRVAIWYAYRDPVDINDWQSGFVSALGAAKPSLAMYARPVSRSKPSIRRGQTVSLWGASLKARGSQQLQMSYDGRSWRAVPRQRRDRNGSVTAVVRGAKTFFVRTKDRQGTGPKLKVAVRR